MNGRRPTMCVTVLQSQPSVSIPWNLTFDRKGVFFTKIFPPCHTMSALRHLMVPGTETIQSEVFCCLQCVQQERPREDVNECRYVDV